MPKARVSCAYVPNEQLWAAFARRDVDGAGADLLDKWMECRATVHPLGTSPGAGWPSASTDLIDWHSGEP
jgi:hypothetical protein